MYKNYGTTDISKGYKATTKVGVTVESELQENKFDWYAERWTYQM